MEAYKLPCGELRKNVYPIIIVDFLFIVIKWVWFLFKMPKVSGDKDGNKSGSKKSRPRESFSFRDDHSKNKPKRIKSKSSPPNYISNS